MKKYLLTVAGDWCDEGDITETHEFAIETEEEFKQLEKLAQKINDLPEMDEDYEYEEEDEDFPYDVNDYIPSFQGYSVGYITYVKLYEITPVDFKKK